jgi:hypothetical protein
MWRSILAIIVGFVAAAVAVGLLEGVGHAIYPPPRSIDDHDPKAARSDARGACTAVTALRPAVPRAREEHGLLIALLQRKDFRESSLY